MIHPFRLSAETWSAIVTAAATSALAFLTWRTVRAMTSQLSAPKRDKHLDYLHSAILLPLSQVLNEMFRPIIDNGLLPVDSRASIVKPKAFAPFKVIPLADSELDAHFGELALELEKLVHRCNSFLDKVWQSAIIEAERDGPDCCDCETVRQFLFQCMFADTTLQIVLGADNSWCLKAPHSISVGDIPCETRAAAENLRAALVHGIASRRPALEAEYSQVCLQYERTATALSRALSAVHLKGVCEACPVE